MIQVKREKAFWCVAALAVLAVYGIARVKLGGQTGDILGAGQQITELAVLLALVPASYWHT